MFGQIDRAVVLQKDVRDVVALEEAVRERRRDLVVFGDDRRVVRARLGVAVAVDLPDEIGVLGLLGEGGEERLEDVVADRAERRDETART